MTRQTPPSQLILHAIRPHLRNKATPGAPSIEDGTFSKVYLLPMTPEGACEPGFLAKTTARIPTFRALTPSLFTWRDRLSHFQEGIPDTTLSYGIVRAPRRGADDLSRSSLSSGTTHYAGRSVRLCTTEPRQHPSQRLSRRALFMKSPSHNAQIGVATR